ncbi:MAG: hypothetical protein ACRYGG_20930 [Janthinobacterium lividum]
MTTQIAQLAKSLGIHRQTVDYWIKQRWVPAPDVQTSACRHQYSPAGVVEFLAAVERVADLRAKCGRPMGKKNNTTPV